MAESSPSDRAYPSELFRLDGKVALVTGGSRGLGREIVRAYARAGADVIIASRREESCQELAREIHSTTGSRASAMQCHTGSWSSMEDLAERALAEHGRVDVLVNAAGIAIAYERLADVTEAIYDKTLDVNAKGHFRLTTLIGGAMKERGSGSIIFVSSTAGLVPLPEMLPYSVSKAGLHAMTTGFAWEFGPEVRVNCLMPGPFHTQMAQSWDMEAALAGARRGLILQRIAEPPEIAGAALYLASDASSFTSGAVLSVTGGSEFKHRR